MTSNNTVRLGAKFDKSVADQFKEFCEKRGENISSNLRRLVLEELCEHSYLDSEHKKALGVGRDD